jgi:hypothetical protein
MTNVNDTLTNLYEDNTIITSSNNNHHHDMDTTTTAGAVTSTTVPTTTSSPIPENNVVPNSMTSCIENPWQPSSSQRVEDENGTTTEVGVEPTYVTTTNNEQLLYDMGFTHRHWNRTLLVQHQNDLDRTVESLLLLHPDSTTNTNHPITTTTDREDHPMTAHQNDADNKSSKNHDEDDKDDDPGN